MKKKILIIIPLILIILVVVFLIIFKLNSKKEKYYSCSYKMSEDKVIKEILETKLYYKNDKITKYDMIVHVEVKNDDLYKAIKENNKLISDTYKKDGKISYRIKNTSDIVGKSIEIFTKNDMYKCTLKED